MALNLTAIRNVSRLSPNGGKQQPTQPTEEEKRRAARRESGKNEERNRGKRMFGALLGALSQSGSSAAQKRRADIEKRQQAKLKQISDDATLREREQLEQLKQRRRLLQWKFDEQSMRIRHSNMLAMAKFLSTKAEPKLYYKPWELQPEDEDQIERQIIEAEEQIEHEVADFEQRRRKAVGEEDQVTTKDHDAVEQVAPSKSMVGSEPSKEAVESDPTNAGDANADPTEQLTNNGGEMKVEGVASSEASRAEELVQDVVDGEVVVEAEEDTVIY